MSSNTIMTTNLKKAGLVHLGLSILLIVYGKKIFSNPDTIVDVFPECGGNVKAFEEAYKGGTRASYLNEDGKRIIVMKVLGVCLSILGVILASMDLKLCVFKDDIEFLNTWLRLNILLMVLYTLWSLLSMFQNSNKLWIHLSELVLYFLAWILILLVRSVKEELSEEKEPVTLDSTSPGNECQVSSVISLK